MDKLKELIGEGWFNQLSPILESDSFKAIKETLREKKTIIAPRPNHIFRAFELCPWEDVRVVILGQDPYHTVVKTTEGKTIPQASGLAFGVPKGTTFIPPSLRNIKAELDLEYQEEISNFDYSLEFWAKQGVLLLNTALTVEYGRPNIHSKLWAPFTEHVVKTLSQNKPGLIWLLWGKHAQDYKKFMSHKTNHILETGHPSPLSAKYWFKNNHFIKTNNIINSMNGPFEEINWYEGMDLAPF